MGRQHPWLVTRYADQRALLADPRVSADVTQPGYPQRPRRRRAAQATDFITMDDPEHARLRRMVTGAVHGQADGGAAAGRSRGSSTT